MKWIRGIIAILMLLFLALTAEGAHAAGIQLFYDGSEHMYTGSVYKLYVNGNEINAAMEPILFNDHALVPVREVFEALGAEVDYTGENRCVEIQYGRTYIRMYINDNCAYVNGKRTEIPDNVVPKLINKPGGLTKTMVPVRFIGETTGMGVNFDGNTGSILITADSYSEPEPEPTEAPAPEPTPVPTAKPTAPPTVQPAVRPSEAPMAKPTAVPTADPAAAQAKIKSITSSLENKTCLTVKVTGDSALSGRYNSFTLKSPERVVIDFYDMDYDKGDTATQISGAGISAVRTGVNSERTRVVIDVENLLSYTVNETSADKLVITVNVTGKTATEAAKSEENKASAIAYAKGITKATAADAKKVIMLDAGHGGSDPGAIGELNGRTINEKDLTLSITYKVKAILEENGYKTSMTRTGDTLPSLSERPAQANEEGCALFVSIHINSAGSDDASGTEVYWSEENNGDEYGVTSEEFAGNVLAAMLKYMKSVNRGVRMANWAVIRRSEMPAILAEVGFISNEAELKQMCSDEYQNKVARGIAEGIINTIHTVEIP